MKSGKKTRMTGKYFLGSVLALYLASGLFSPEKTAKALEASLHLLLTLLPLFAAVILLSALIGYWLRPEALARYLGAQSGIRGWGIALLAGVLSHGPMYAWYPMLSTLKNQGMGNALITVFLYARAVKLPLLPLMIDYFGVAFSLLLNAFILLGALLQGKLIAWSKI